MPLELISENKVHDGWHRRYRHYSQRNQCDMVFAVYTPPQAAWNMDLPVLYWLSGLTCTDENFMQKAGAFAKASDLGIVIVAPDTSPRGEEVPDESEQYDFGKGAGFYLDAKIAPYAHNYNMYSYISEELPSLIDREFEFGSQKAVAGHSMGGHGALTIGLKHTDKYSSISAFAPICHPSQTPWGINAFTKYLGEDKEQWRQYDATCLMSQTDHVPPILIDQGDADQFLATELKPEALLEVAGSKVEYQLHAGYDHSYFFISSFIDKHLQFHAKHFKT